MGLHNFTAINLPYLLQRINEEDWIALNREYKPLGFFSSGWFDYHTLPIGAIYKRLTDRFLIEKIAHNDEKFYDVENGKVVRVWLYDDGCNPFYSADNRRLYFEKLSKLMTKEVKIEHYHYHIPKRELKLL